MATIKLYGHLKRFGSEFDLDINDAAEGIRALCYQIPGFKQAMQKGHYKVRIGKEYLSAETLEKGLFYRLKKGMKIHITPAIQGAKKGGVFQAILGAVIIVASIVSYQWYNVSYGVAMMWGSMGASLALGGVAQMLAKTPVTTNSKIGDEEAVKNTAFSNLENLSPQGRPVPLVYGEILTSGIIISQGIETFNKTESEGKETGTGNIGTGGSSGGGGGGGSGGGFGGFGDSLGWEDPDGLPNPNVVPAEVWKAAWREAQRRKEEKQKQNGG